MQVAEGVDRGAAPQEEFEEPALRREGAEATLMIVLWGKARRGGATMRAFGARKLVL